MSDSDNATIPVKLRPDVAQEIYQIATKLQLPVDTLVNEFLQHYVAEQSTALESNGATVVL
ncbi:hypothetical protein BH10CHL1_BH10CHL1_48970 [soil metagenome]